LIKKEKLIYLRQLKAESIQILCKVVPAFINPVMMHSVVKDYFVMLHLAMKAFGPSKLPMEWDTATAGAIVRESGKIVINS